MPPDPPVPPMPPDPPVPPMPPDPPVPPMRPDPPMPTSVAERVDGEVGDDGPRPLVSTRGLTKRYGRLVALDQLDLDVPRGAIYGIIGPNGAGKSTMFAILATLLRPTAGTATVCGSDPVSKPKEVRRRIGYMPDVMGVYDRLRVDEYLQFHASAYGVPRNEWPELVDGLLELVDLDVKRNAMVDGLSRGMKQRLSLARSLVHDPEVLILDEPASGLDPRARIEFRQLLAELQLLGKTILISSHILAELQQMCTDIAVIEAGRLLASGTPAAIVEQLGTGRRVTVRFLGGEEADFPVADEAEQAALLKRLIGEGREVVEFTVDTHDLEDLFLQITNGVVQ
jgi:ABC-2 type transport system ATP-binding protein